MSSQKQDIYQLTDLVIIDGKRALESLWNRERCDCVPLINSRSSERRGQYRSLWVPLNLILCSSQERVGAEILGHKGWNQLKCLAVSAFTLPSFMFSFAVASLPIVVLFGGNFFQIVSASFPLKTLGKTKTDYNMTETCQALNTNHEQSMLFNALGDL